MITALGKLTAQPGKIAFLHDVCVTLAKETREKEKGCLAYIPYTSTENPAEIIIIGKYVNEEAFETHRQSSHLKEAREKLPQLVEEKSTDILDGELIVTILKELV